MVKAVLFDMDGTLVDTENLDNEVAIKICKKLGFELTEEEQKERHGRTTKSFYEYLRLKRKADFNLQQAAQNQIDGFTEKLQTNLKAFSGARELPKLLAKNGYALAIVSGSTKSQIELVLQSLKIGDYFKMIISANDVLESKPNPEGYLLAAENLNVSPTECVIIEDGTKGVKAGKSAGMKVIGVINNGGQDLSLADMTVSNLQEIKVSTIQSL